MGLERARFCWGDGRRVCWSWGCEDVLERTGREARGRWERQRMEEDDCGDGGGRRKAASSRIVGRERGRMEGILTVGSRWNVLARSW